MNMNLQERASAPVVSSTQSGQTFVKSNMLQDQMPGFGPGPLHVRMSIPMHRTVAPYMIPNGPQNYVMEKRTKLGADMQVWNISYSYYISLTDFNTVNQVFFAVILSFVL